MQYALLIYDAESESPQPGTPEFEQLLVDYRGLTEEMQKKGVMKGGQALKSVSTATTVRVRGGKTRTTDGPFAETKEQLGGFYLLDCQDLDEAIEWAARLPSARIGSIEIRPVEFFAD